jgi:hypothetical protein
MVKRWRITFFVADGELGLVIECHRLRTPTRLARACLWMDQDLVRYEIELM